MRAWLTRALLALTLLANLWAGGLGRPAAALAAPAKVNSPNIVVDVSRHQADFPTAINFSLSAHDDAGPITAVTILFSVADQPQPALNVRQAQFTPGKSIEARWRWDLSQSYIPPGVEVSYFWEIKDEQGGVRDTDPQRFILVDSRFRWRQIQGPNVIVNWYRGDDAFGRQTLDVTVQSLATFRNQIGATLQRPVRLLIYGSQKDFQGILPPHSKEWIGGQTMADFGLIVAPIEPGNGQLAEMRRVLPHELAHLLTHQITRNPYATVPAWLDEGLSAASEQSMEPGLDQVLNQAIKNKRLMSLRSLSGNFPADPREAALAYAESNAAVLYVLKTYGRERFYRILTLIHQGNFYEDAIKQALGVDIDKLSADFQQALLSGSFTITTSAPPGGRGQAAPAAQAAPTDVWHNLALQVVVGVVGGVLAIYLALGVLVKVRRRRRAAG